MGWIKYLLVAFAVGNVCHTRAQVPLPDAVLVIGQVLEADSYTGLPFAHVRVGTRATTTDFKGIFKIRVSPHDTISVSYVGYKTEEITVPENLAEKVFETKITLHKDTVFLNNANITILPASIEAFKQAVLSLELNEQEYRNVQKNMEAMTRQLSIYNYDKYTMDAGENYREAMRGPQGFNFKAVFDKMRKALVPPSKESTPAPPPVYYQPTLPLDSLRTTDTLYLTKPDTVRAVDNK